jgi:FAD/FMN-containing dehydrogenase
MSKVASYLQEHISGEVSVNPYVLDAMSRDGSFLQATPELVVYPRTTNDVRKIARFSWQLAERGHTLAITARGGGSDQTGAAIGSGLILSFPAHMNTIFEYEPRHKLVRLQPGVNAQALSDALWLHGVSIPVLPASAAYSTVGGAVANNSSGVFSGKYGAMNRWVEQLEVVLANGEVIQTGRISRRELNRKKGFQTLEGEIYRSLDNLIEDNKELIGELSDRIEYTNAGYVQIASVKKKDGSFDLTPLFTGSQGTIGIISEMILRADYISSRLGVAVAVFADKDAARDCIAALAGYNPAFLDYFDGELIELADKAGRRYGFSKKAGFDTGAALLIGFDDSSNRKRSKKLKRTGKVLKEFGAWFTIANGEGADDLMALRDVLAWAAMPNGAGISAPPLLSGAYVPPEQFSVFAAGVKALGTKYHIPLPLFGNELTSLYYAWPIFNLKKTSDKQKMFKLLDEFATLVDKTGGELVGEAGEGRLKSKFVQRSFDDKTVEMFEAVKSIFDPYGILNPGVKQPSDIKLLATMLRDDYHTPGLPDYVPYA